MSEHRIRRRQEQKDALDIIDDSNILYGPGIDDSMIQHRVMMNTAINVAAALNLNTSTVNSISQSSKNNEHLESSRKCNPTKSFANTVPLNTNAIQLLPHNLTARLQFSQIIQQYRADHMDFHKKILFTDESCFTRYGITNLHNQHVYADENPHAIRAKSFQREFNINVWSRWIGRGNDAPISWPPRSPDLNPCDFFIWGDLKQKVYSVSIENEEQLWNIIQNAVFFLKRIAERGNSEKSAL
ncbi:hypothetical protein NQ318_009296 [Aromia moschata]|uniref:Tc1-like transposase DDE domain-containing protein n=1 Tax=Aromia moschata TaxID=1265417 RepID=A0AAV8YHR8_9CUCU|nr:hypothetical protein NQ318_009296 [Aromia moschata]